MNSSILLAALHALKLDADWRASMIRFRKKVAIKLGLSMSRSIWHWIGISNSYLYKPCSKRSMSGLGIRIVCVKQSCWATELHAAVNWIETNSGLHKFYAYYFGKGATCEHLTQYKSAWWENIVIWPTYRHFHWRYRSECILWLRPSLPNAVILKRLSKMSLW